jgi:tetratricopeptide (TPR) repeat protein
MWEEALPGLYEFDVLYRNLGLAAWQREKNNPKAIDLFEKALQLNPRNQDLYLHLDDLYRAEGLVEKRRQLLETIKALPDVREDLRKRSIQMRVDLGLYEEALAILETETFVPLEMDQSFHDLYVRALMLRAADHLQAGRVEEAIAVYRQSTTYPENLGVGQPVTLNQAHIYYHLGLAYEQLGRFPEALAAWRTAASEHHPHGHELFAYVQMALDKLSRYSELGFEI